MMTFQNLLSQIPQWTLGKIPDGYTSKDIARITAINIFGLIIVTVCATYSVIFFFQEDYYLFWICLSIAVFCAIPLFLNALSQFNISRTIYAIQAPPLVLVFTLLLGPGFGIQYFFVLLFSFPFIYFKTNETPRIILFYLYNVICMAYFEFGGTLGLEEAAFTSEMYLALKITIFLMFLIMAFTLFFAFYRVVIIDEQKFVKSTLDKEKAIHGQHELMAAMSHELRTPLNDVVTIVNILEENPEHRDRLAFIKLLKQTSNNMLSITNDIIDFSELEANKANLNLKSRDLKQVINGLVYTYRSIAEKKGLKLTTEIDHDLEKRYLIDETKLGQIIANLITNAIKHTDSGVVQLTVKKENSEGVMDDVCVEVSDTGKGIAAEKLEKIFENYSPIRTMLSDPSGSTGIGLAIVRRLLKLHDSDITVESAPGIGSKFSFKLRLRSSRKKPEGTSADIEKLLDKKILLVEDNMVNAMVAEKLLENWGLLVIKKENGQEALDALEQETFDFVLMDLHMPVMNGIEATQKIRLRESPYQNIPIYALTADIMVDSKDEFNDIFNGFLSKPIDKEKLQSILISTFSE